MLEKLRSNHITEPSSVDQFYDVDHMSNTSQTNLYGYNAQELDENTTNGPGNERSILEISYYTEAIISNITYSLYLYYFSKT